jgi:hypothetical protein
VEPLDNATPVDWRSNCYSARYVSITQILDLFRNLNDLNPDIPIDMFGQTWHSVASEAVEVMAEGRNPLQINSFLSAPDKKVKVYPLLGGLTRFFCQVADSREIQFDDKKLWDFVEHVHRWCCGDQTPDILVRATALLNIAITELNKVAARARIASKRSSSTSRATAPAQSDEGTERSNRQNARSEESERRKQELEREEVHAVLPESTALSSPAAERPKPDRLTIDPSTRNVCLDGKSSVIEHAVAFRILWVIAEAKGALVTSNEFREKVSGCSKCRIDVLLNRHLPPWVRDLLRGQSGHNGGYSLLLPEIVRNGARSTRKRTYILTHGSAYS